MNCSQVEKKLSAFMDNELDDPTSRFIYDHLKDCPRCRKFLYQFNDIDGLVRVLPNHDPSPDFSWRIVQAALGNPQVAERNPVPSSSRLKFALTQFSENIIGLFRPWSGLATPTLEEFSDSPPLSMSFIYFKLIGQPKQGF
ncbi:MAG: zf-HC2 domain-containing protein [Thermodesulfobacteriota bacterium]